MERAISKIQGAIPLREFHAPDDGGDDDSVVVVVYCTIGYRSGMEATRLHQRYPNLRIYNLDGIVAFSHAVQDDSRIQLVSGDDETRKADHVHTFACLWDYVDETKFESTSYGCLAVPVRLI